MSDNLVLKKENLVIHKKINISKEYILGKTLGKGAFAQVRLAVHKATKQNRAVKIINKKSCGTLSVQQLLSYFLFNFTDKLLSEESSTDKSGIVSKLGNANLCLLIVVLGISFTLNDLHNRLEEIVALSADTAANAEYLRLEEIDDIDKSAS